ncbi:hypothetical protein BWQ96_07199 [Gracilariopsis chorda]|uniref:Methyltransferase FkbM domain-containing protein n=1 Tax=Gracilariopsis chorda TaxID=448386 RepID=A0A2V3ILT3_9FLOR|nr:hypothetical protein BWQ96_07199 [Gracilariopsis chorda]|eukprot:PXF43052.1 hypothetical protein BWQ96_07199 [Gracilariopsis chorda]
MEDVGRVRCALLSVLLCHLIVASARSPTQQFPHGFISPSLHQQALSHIAFHSNAIKLALASLFPSLKAAAVVGVEWGQETFLFAENDFHVYAFEPANKFVDHLKRIVENNPQWNYTLVPIAAANESEGTIILEYENADINETVQVGKVDDHVHEPLAVFSLDIQGDELHVLQGSTKLLSKDVGVASLWVEAIACNDKVATILHMLDDQYVAFDFVPWGHHVTQKAAKVPRSLNSFAYAPDRPGGYSEYLSWMCELQQKEYKWLQTDFLFIRRDYLTADVHNKLLALADTHCSKSSEFPADCQLRQLLAEHRSERKDEL